MAAILLNIATEHYGEHFSEIILNFDQCFLSTALAALFVLAGGNHLCNFGRGHYREQSEQSCEIINQ